MRKIAHLPLLILGIPREFLPPPPPKPSNQTLSYGGELAPFISGKPLWPGMLSDRC